MVDAFVTAASKIDNGWSIAAFAIAAILAVLEIVSRRVSGLRQGRHSRLKDQFIWLVVAAICVLASMPILANLYLTAIDRNAIYRVRVVVLDPDQRPVSGASLRTTVSNERTTTGDGDGLLTIPRATLPTDRRLTIFADYPDAFMHGRLDMQLADDLNPSVMVRLRVERDAKLTGTVQDGDGRGIMGATVSVVGGGAAITGSSGQFDVPANTAVGQVVQVRVERDGYKTVNEHHRAGTSPVTVVLSSEPARAPR